MGPSLRVGDEFGPSGWTEITSAMLERFVAATGAREALDMVMPYVVLSLLPGMSSQVVPRPNSRLSVNYGLNKVRFGALPTVGSRLSGSFRIADWGLQMVMTATVHEEGGSSPACVAELVSRAYR